MNLAPLIKDLAIILGTDEQIQTIGDYELRYLFIHKVLKLPD